MPEIGYVYSRVKELFFKYVPSVALWLDLIGAAILYTLVTAYLPTQNGDNIEHIHSSFLVATGQVPYRDFFQHHNPLLWYLAAPLTKLFAYDTTITEVVCLVSFLVFLKSLVYVYRICKEFLADNFCGLAAAAIIATPGYKLYAVDFRPDNYMIFCLMGGIYYYFSYLKHKKPFHLTAAFLWFFFSFMFAQKALFPLAVLGVSGLYFWYTGEIKTKDMLRALIMPLVGLGLFGLYLLYYDMVGLYFLCNYTFNLNLAEGFELFKIAVLPDYMKVMVWIGWIGVLFSLFARNRYLVVLSLLFACEYFQRLFYFSPYAYYYWLLFSLATLCSVPVLFWLNAKNRGVGLIIIVGVYWFLCRASMFYYHFSKQEQEHMYLPDYITRRITPCDYVFNGDGMMYNIFGKDPAYYWQLIGQLDVAGERTGIRPRPNMNALIEELKPRFVFGRNYFNKFSEESGRKEVVHYIDKELIEKYYNSTQFGSVYELKPEYAARPCHRHAVTGEWVFED